MKTNTNNPEKGWNLFRISSGLIIAFVIMLGACSRINAQTTTTVTPNQSYVSNDPKMISIIATDTKSVEIKVKNDEGYPEIYIMYRYKPGDSHWARIGSVSIFPNTEAKFFVEPGYQYGYNVENKEPKKIGSKEKKWKVHYSD